MDTDKPLEQQITETLDRLRLARDLGATETIEVTEKRLDYLLVQVHRRETAS